MNLSSVFCFQLDRTYEPVHNMNCKEVNICLLKNLAIQSLLMKKC
nr:MAG TPA: protein of unknown function (DUF333) [Caudoviricetes sp.]DAO15532.1 MAG TPA: protein of unknown function (DUF333) [Caudoviricetes sp.]